MANILCIETATEVCSVCISTTDRGVVASFTLADGRRHSSELTTCITKCLEQAGMKIKDLDAVALSDGPGSYTGLRVGASTAKGICYAQDIPLIAVPTLQSLATRYADEAVLTTIDARRMEVYAAVYQDIREVVETHSLIWTEESCQEIAASYDLLIICGDGVAKAAELFRGIPHVQILPSVCDATLLARIAQEKYAQKTFVDVAYYTPFYFKSPKINVKANSLLS